MVAWQKKNNFHYRHSTLKIMLPRIYLNFFSNICTIFLFQNICTIKSAMSTCTFERFIPSRSGSYPIIYVLFYTSWDSGDVDLNVRYRRYVCADVCQQVLYLRTSLAIKLKIIVLWWDMEVSLLGLKQLLISIQIMMVSVSDVISMWSCERDTAPLFLRTGAMFL